MRGIRKMLDFFKKKIVVVVAKLEWLWKIRVL